MGGIPLSVRWRGADAPAGQRYRAPDYWRRALGLHVRDAPGPAASPPSDRGPGHRRLRRRLRPPPPRRAARPGEATAEPRLPAPDRPAPSPRAGTRRGRRTRSARCRPSSTICRCCSTALELPPRPAGPSRPAAARLDALEPAPGGEADVGDRTPARGAGGSARPRTAIAETRASRRAARLACASSAALRPEQEPKLDATRRVLHETICGANLWLDTLLGGDLNVDNARRVRGASSSPRSTPRRTATAQGPAAPQLRHFPRSSTASISSSPREREERSRTGASPSPCAPRCSGSRPDDSG